MIRGDRLCGGRGEIRRQRIERSVGKRMAVEEGQSRHDVIVTPERPTSIADCRVELSLLNQLHGIALDP